jgi:2-keto-4-pentenoate hydratase/2-oxohepta-3-ene-1,7-dioic acid hydratase in catechol pathway
MRIVSFSKNDHTSVGIVSGDGVIDAGRRLGLGSDLRAVLEQGRLSELAQVTESDADYALDEIRYRPVIANPAAKFICVGLNYRPHMREMGREPPKHPVIFVRFASSLVGHREAMIKPVASEQFDFEGELAVVIGRPARHVPRASALDYVAGYSCVDEGSVRDFQRHTSQFTPGKNFFASGSFGPWLVTADEIPDPAALRLETRLNGEIVQSESTGELCFSIPELIEYISIWTPLLPGDVIATGTPGGVGAGRKPPLWMQPGDTVEVEISGIGTLSNPIDAESAD